MRKAEVTQHCMYGYRFLEERITETHPPHPLRIVVDGILQTMNRRSKRCIRAVAVRRCHATLAGRNDAAVPSIKLHGPPCDKWHDCDILLTVHVRFSPSKTARRKCIESGRNPTKRAATPAQLASAANRRAVTATGCPGDACRWPMAPARRRWRSRRD